MTTHSTHSDPDDGRSIAELDRGVARAADIRIEFDTMEADIKAAHDMIEWFRKHRAHRAQQRDAAKRLHRRK